MIKRRGKEWFESRFLPLMHNVGAVALLTILVMVFLQEAETIVSNPLTVGLIALPIVAQFAAVIFIVLGLAWLAKFNYEDAAMCAFIGSGTQFEIAIATAAVLFGIGSGAALATVVGPLLEVPLMIAFTKVVIKTRSAFHPSSGEDN